MKTTLLMSLVLLALIVTPPVQAQNDSNSQRGQGIEISPPLVELEADPGESVTVDIRLRNVTDLELVAQGAVNDFLAGDESGTPQILFEEDDPSPYSLKEFIPQTPTVTLEPRELKTAQVTIEVPEGAAPGGHYGIIRFVALPESSGMEGSAVDLSASVGTLVLLDVSGEVERSLDVREFITINEPPEDSETSQEQGSEEEEAGVATSFFEYAPVSFRTRLSNTGTVHLQPQGGIRVYNTLGNETGKIQFNPTDRNILPDSLSRFNHTLDKEWMLGRYTAEMEVGYGDGEAVTATTAFWVIPYKIIGIILVMLAAIGFFGRKALRVYKQNVVRKYQQQNEPGDQHQTGA